MNEDTLPETAEKLLVYYEAWIRPDLRARRVGTSGASVRAWLMTKFNLSFAEAQKIQAMIRDNRPGLYAEHERAE